MMKPILNAMRLQAQRQATSSRGTSVGTVTSYDPDNYAVRVELQAEGILTGWMPLCSPWIGNGWGFFAAPSVGDMVEVTFFGGDIEAGYVEGRLFNDIDLPLSVPSAEFWVVHQSGSFLKFTNAGDVLVTSARDLAAVVGRNLTANVTGDIDVACGGNAGVTVQGNATATVNGSASITVADNATIGVGGSATATIGGALDVTAATASVTAVTTITGNTEIVGTLTVSGNIATTTGSLIATTGEVEDSSGTMATMRTTYNDHKGHGTPGTGNAPDHLM